LGFVSQRDPPPAATHQVSTIPCFGGPGGLIATRARTAPLCGSTLIRNEGFSVSSQAAPSAKAIPVPSAPGTVKVFFVPVAASIRVTALPSKWKAHT
jgi:hypothetical protein